jgi:hypothetical protein
LSSTEPRISYYAAPEIAACAAFIEESRMRFADPTKLTGNPGEVEGSAFARMVNLNPFGVHHNMVCWIHRMLF